MATRAEIAEIEAMTDAEVTALAYIEAAGGDAQRALIYAVEDALRLEDELAAAFKAISTGYVRGSISAP